MNRYVLFLIFLSSSLFALKRESIGKIVAIEGVVKAIIEEKMRILEQESPIFIEDLIEVGLESRAQIEFSDGTITNLIPETQFRIDSYKYKKILQKDTLIVELIKGGLRTLSGSISKRNLEGYKIRTPSATIGLRGTVVEAAITSEGVYVGVQKGQAFIENRTKSILIGMGEPLQFAFVKDINSGFELISQRPQALNPPVFSAPPGGVPICEEISE